MLESEYADAVIVAEDELPTVAPVMATLSLATAGKLVTESSA